MSYNQENIEEQYEPGAVENVEETMGTIIKSLDKFESIIEHVSNNLRQHLQNNQKCVNNTADIEGVVETHFILDRDNQTESVLRFPLQTLAELEQIESPVFHDIVSSYIKKTIQDYNYNITETLNQILSEELLNQLTWEEDAFEVGRVPLQNFTFFSSELYGNLKF